MFRTLYGWIWLGTVIFWWLHAAFHPSVRTPLFVVDPCRPWVMDAVWLCSAAGVKVITLYGLFFFDHIFFPSISTSNILSMESQPIGFVIGGLDHAVCRYSVIKYLWFISSFCACCQECVIWAKIQTLLDVNLTKRIILGTNRNIYFQISNFSFMWPCYRYLIKKIFTTHDLPMLQIFD